MERIFRRPPPAVLLAMAGLAQHTMTRGRSVTPSSMAAAAPVAGGSLCLLAGSAGNFLRHRTTVDPVRVERAQHLVVDGPNRLTRNPMYLGMLLALAGWAVWLGNGAALLALPLFVAVLNTLQIRPEEAALRARFGADYVRYAQRVRRWA